MIVTNKVFSDGMIDQSQSTSNFLAMNVLFSKLKKNGHYRILDMGPARNANINFFSAYHCSLHIEDLYRTIQENPDTDIVDLLQQYDIKNKFDVILFWDLFDYLEQPQLEKLIAHLSGYCHEDTMLFFLTWGMDKIPETPANFHIIDRQHLRYENDAPNTRNAKGYKQAMYKKLLPGFTLYRGFRMSSGMEENLFVFKEQTANLAETKTAV